MTYTTAEEAFTRNVISRSARPPGEVLRNLPDKAREAAVKVGIAQSNSTARTSKPKAKSGQK